MHEKSKNEIWGQALLMEGESSKVKGGRPMMDEEWDSKGSHWVKIISVPISGLAIVGVAHHYFRVVG